MGWGGRRLYKTDRARDFDHERDRQTRTRQIYDTIDRQGYQWIVVFVAGVGFFLDGYTLFASNVALPMIDYVYWQDSTSTTKQTTINIATLAGTLFGQVVFGILADKYGRKRMYGAELVLLITATLGVTMCSTGTHNSMSIYAWLIWWKLVVGVGVGADYPLSAVITSEFAPTKHRARMLATVFFMQPLGQIAANLVSLIVVAAAKSQHSDDLTRTFDQLWRWIVGLGVVPGVIAVVFRFAIPETPRYIIEIEDDPIKAEFDASYLFGESMEMEQGGSWHGSITDSNVSGVSHSFEETPATVTNFSTPTYSYNITTPAMTPTTLNSRWTLSKADIIQYFWTEGNWRTLAGTSLCWLLLDFGFYGVGFANPQFLAKTWGTLRIHGSRPPWQTDDRPNFNLFDDFIDSSYQALVILNAGSFFGGLVLIALAPKINRVSLQKYGFLFLAAVFITLGTIFVTIHQEGPLAIVLYVVAEFAFNFGPNATTYMLPAEVFPSRYRASCHGISAGMGKLGAIIVQIFSAYYKFGSTSPNESGTHRYGTILIIFSVTMFLGALITHFCIPQVQEKRPKSFFAGKSEKLEEIALGRAGIRSRFIQRNRSI